MANTEGIGSCVEQIPFEGLEAVGRIFAEGMKKYGKDNWKNDPSAEYRIERCRHAIRHLMLFANGDRGEEHLAKVAWFCLTEIYLSKKLGDVVNTTSINEEVRTFQDPDPQFVDPQFEKAIEDHNAYVKKVFGGPSNIELAR